MGLAKQRILEFEQRRREIVLEDDVVGDGHAALGVAKRLVGMKRIQTLCSSSKTPLCVPRASHERDCNTEYRIDNPQP